jgi:hypothetical protein
MTRRATGTAPTPAPTGSGVSGSRPERIGPGPADCRERCAHHGPRPGTDHVVFTKPRMPSRPALASLFARSWAPPFTLRAGPPGAAPLTTPQWGCAPSRGTPDSLIPIVLRASGWRSSPVPGARPRLQPPARRGRVPVAIHRLFTGRPQAFPTAIHRTAISSRLSEPTHRARIAPLSRTHSRRASAAWAPASSHHTPQMRPRFPTRTTPVPPAIAHLGTLPAPARYLAGPC